MNGIAGTAFGNNKKQCRLLGILVWIDAISVGD